MRLLKNGWHWLTDIFPWISYEKGGVSFWNLTLVFTLVAVSILFALRYALPAIMHHRKKEGRISESKRNQKNIIFIKYFKRFFFQIVTAISLICLLFPIYCSGGYDGTETILFPMNFVRTLYHMLRFFVIEADIRETLEVINRVYSNTNQEFFRLLYRIAICICCFLAPILTMTAIMSVFKKIRANFNYFKSRGDVYIFSELNEKSAALADSLLEKSSFSKRPVIVFTDVLEPDSELQFDLQESAEEKGAICFRNDLESINYRNCLNHKKRKFTFYLINDDEAEKIRHATFISKNYDDRGVDIYIFSDKTSCKLFLSVSEQFKKASVIRIDEIQSLIYYNLHANGVRLFETAKKNHKENKNDEKIVIRAVIIGFGRYGREMFKALLWFCQIPGYEIDIHVIDNSANLKSRLMQDYPELMAKRKFSQDIPESCLGDAQYYISASNESIDVNTNQFTKALRKIVNPTYVFIALGDDEENIRTSIKVRELYQKMGCEPDIETVVYDANMADSMSYRWPLAGCLDAARLIFQDGFFNSGYRASFSPLYCALPEYFRENLSTHAEDAQSIALSHLKKNVIWGYDIDIQKLYERDDYLKKRHDSKFTPEEYQREIIKVISPRISEDTVSSASGNANILKDSCSATVTEKDNMVQIRVQFCFYTVEDRISSTNIRGIIMSAFDDAEKEMTNRKDGVCNFKKQPYKIHMIGDLKNFYRHEIIINNNLIEKGQGVDERWNKTNRQNSKLAISIYERLSELAENEIIYPRRNQKVCEVFVLKLKMGTLFESDDHTIKDLLFNFSDVDLKKKLHAYTIRTDDTTNLIITDAKGKGVDAEIKNEMILYLFNQFRSDVHNMRDDALNSRIHDIEEGFGTTEITTYVSTKILPFVAEFIRKMDGVTAIRTKYNNRIMVLVNDEINNSFVDFSFPYSPNGSVCPQTKCVRCLSIQDGPHCNGNCQNQWNDLCNSIENIHKVGERGGRSRTVADVYVNCNSCLYRGECGPYNSSLLRILDKSPLCRNLCVKLRNKYLMKIHKNCPHQLNVLEELISSMKIQKAVCLSCEKCASQCISYMRLKCMLDSMQIYSNRNYYKFEYNQRASITKYMHETLRFRLLRCGYIDDELRTAFADKNFYVFEQLREAKSGELAHKGFVRHMISAIEKDPINVTTLEEQLVIGSLEHIRWNAYMRTEGYSFNIKRNDMAKQHHLLLPLHYLYLSDIRKDV